MKPLKILSPLHKARRQLEIHLEKQVREYDVSVIEGHLLTFLLSYRPASVGGLCRMTGFKPSTMTSILDRMDERGFIERSPNPEDRRSWLVDLKPAGLKLAGKIRTLVEDFEAAVIAELDEGDLEGFHRVFEAIDRVTSISIRE